MIFSTVPKEFLAMQEYSAKSSVVTLFMMSECLFPLLMVPLVTITPSFVQNTTGDGHAWTWQTSSTWSPVREWMNNSSASISNR